MITFVLSCNMYVWASMGIHSCSLFSSTVLFMMIICLLSFLSYLICENKCHRRRPSMSQPMLHSALMVILC